jgi:serine/threonine-protein kinase
MNSERWERVQELFHEAAERSPDARRGFLEEACGGDTSLLHDVLALLDEDASIDSFLDGDIGEIAVHMLAESAAALPNEQQFGPYRIERVLGEGGMGVVYLASREDLGTQVAIKLLRDAWMSPARRERFMLERRTLAQLNHPFIARLYDADTLPDGTPWFAMEYVEGVPVTEYCRVHASAIAEKLRLFRAVCEAVQYAHSHAIIHRDLKPSNILVKDDSSATLLDFGIARQLDTEGVSLDQTRTGLRLMTPAYAAPEQIRGEPASVQTDVYSLGIILYELLTGRLPFDPAGHSSGELERMILEREPARPSSIAGTAALSRTSWADLDVLCLTAIRKEPARRYRSVEALIRDLDHYVNGEPLEARPDSIRYRTDKFVRRHASAVIAAAAVLITVVSLTVFFTVRLALARNAAVAQAERAQRIQRFMLNLFNGGDAEAGPAGNLRVISLLDRGVQEAHALDHEPAAQADLYQTLGGIYQELGKLDQAETLLRAALAERKSLEGNGGGDVIDSEVDLGLLRSSQTKLDEAERWERDALEKARSLRPPDNAAVSKALLGLGEVLQARGKFTEAIGILEQDVKLESASGIPTPELATALRDLAINNADAGNDDTAKSLYQRALAMHRQLLGNQHPTVAIDLLSLAQVQQDLGFYSDAERLAREALTINQNYYGNDHPQTADSLTALGRAILYEDRYDEAAQTLERALAICEQLYGNAHPTVAELVNELGSVAVKQGRFDDAERQFQRMIGTYEAIYHDRNHYQVAVGMANLASVYMNRQQWTRAEPLLREALRICIATQGPDHINTGIAHVKLGRTLLRQERYQEAEAQTLAGYEILIKQSNPTDSFLRAARKDLREVYTALNEPEKAKEYPEPAPQQH